jgi:hypothetical protein
MLQVYLTRVFVEVGLTYEAACEIMDSNIEAMNKYGSRIKTKDVGFYVRKQPQNQLGTGKDWVCLATGTIRQASDGRQYTDKEVLMRHPYLRHSTKTAFDKFRMHWKKADDKLAESLWRFWHGWALMSPLIDSELC